MGAYDSIILLIRVTGQVKPLLDTFYIMICNERKILVCVCVCVKEKPYLPNHVETHSHVHCACQSVRQLDALFTKKKKK